MIGEKFGHYRVIEKIGAGGMGVVYRAHDEDLDRDAALKVLAASALADDTARQRFRKEALALSRLNHPHICTIYEVGEAHGQTYIAMEYVEGRQLRGLASGPPLPVETALRFAQQIADALDHAHQRGIVHRDLKSSNVMVTPDGRSKLLDFGLAVRQREREIDEATRSLMSLTDPGTVVGTLAYMAPEVLRREPADGRRDLWALGVMLYEMTAGRLPFSAEQGMLIIQAILHEQPQPLKNARPDVPPGLERIIARALEKDPEARYRSAAELRKDLADLQAELSAPASGPINLKLLARQVRRPRVAVPALAALIGIAVLTGWWARRSAGVRWAREQALPEIQRLAEKESFAAAFDLARQAEQFIPGHPALVRLWPEMSVDVSIETDPPGAEVYTKDYAAAEGEWRRLGQSPLARVRLPRSYARWRLTKAGFHTLERAGPPMGPPGQALRFTLDKEGSVPPGMAPVSGAADLRLNLTSLDHLQPGPLGHFFIDRHEVTNQQFKEFVEAGAYRKREFWKHPFVRQGRALSWEDGIALFRDSTGRPGPATWELGDSPAGQGNYPVSGVSWYEAAAYAEFAGKSLPTIYHWARAAGTSSSSLIVPLSNFRGAGIAAAGQYLGLSSFGSYDMAGNVKEWCSNETAPASHRRYILGGAWNEPVYMFHDPDAQSAIDRSATYGFRCVKYSGQIPKHLTDPVPQPFRDYQKERPVPDEVFRIFERLYAYDKAELDARVESADQTQEHWRTEKVSFNAAYGKERLPAYLFLPKSAAPPFQVVVYYPTSQALRTRSSDMLATTQIDFLVRSGRAVIWPIYKSTFERGDGLLSDRPNKTSVFREHVVQWVKDYSRTIDYLETRPDINVNKAAYFGISWGGVMGAIIPAVEKRLKVAVLVIGGLFQQETVPEVEQINFAARVKIPVLMLGGRYDFVFPAEASQAPMFRFLGTPEKDKQHILFDSGHSVPRNELIKETLNWLDRYLGPAR